MEVVVPFAASDPKTRLAGVLAPAERSQLARAMLADVLDAVVETGHEPTVVATAPLEIRGLAVDPTVEAATSVTVDDRPLTAAVNARLPQTQGDDPVAVVMADLALTTPAALETLWSSDADVAIAPGRGGGTNALVVRHPEFRVDYHGASYLDHRELARTAGATLETIDSFRLGTDVDEPDDLVEVLVHGDETARTPACLCELGFDLDRSDGRVSAVRLEGSTSSR